MINVIQPQGRKDAGLGSLMDHLKMSAPEKDGQSVLTERTGSQHFFSHGTPVSSLFIHTSDI